MWQHAYSLWFVKILSINSEEVERNYIILSQLEYGFTVLLQCKKSILKYRRHRLAIFRVVLLFESLLLDRHLSSELLYFYSQSPFGL